jgi:co-chaperonin GroES (HSP10)
MNLAPLKNNIIFTFLENTTASTFIPTHKSGIIIANPNVEQNRDPKWGKVCKIGPQVENEIKIGQYILIEPLMWSPGFNFEGVQYWKTDSSKVLATSEIPHFSF